ncbi:hypothetical protein N7465_002229 [Penicillium sp. CMV-2018d]|nr:hypothetical protein N7465_002229 [Penicillium sp. CMV-2018d]
MRIKANSNWRGEREFGLDVSKRKFSRDGKLGEARMGIYKSDYVQGSHNPTWGNYNSDPLQQYE